MGQAPESGLSDGVGEVYVMLTWRCNLRCRMCPMWGETGFCRTADNGGETLTVEGLSNWLAGAGSRRPRTVTLSGGEPMLSPLWSPLARRLAADGYRVALTTNATRLVELEQADLEALHQINVSLDGPALVLDALGQGGSDTLDAAIAGLRHVITRRREGRPRLRLLAVVSPEGAGRLAPFVDTLGRAGIDFDDLLLQHTLFLDAATARQQSAALGSLAPPDVPYWDALVGDPRAVDTARLERDLRALAARPEPLVVSPSLPAEQLESYYCSGSWTPPALRRHCLSPWRDMGITPSGDVWLCPGQPIGNLGQGDFDAVWNGPRSRRIRRHIAEEGTFPGCRACFYLYNYRGG